MARKRRRVGGAVGDAVLSVAALGGLACIVLVGLSFAFNVSLIMFKTGSMSPTIPAGSLAVVREIGASDIRVGDVLTVDRAGMLPVTHRVTSVSGSGQTRTITMRGDANEAEDPAPYTLTEAKRVLGSVPHLARVVVWFSHPGVLAALTVGTATLVTWAFWPRASRPAAGRASSATLVCAAGITLALTLAPGSAPPAQAAGAAAREAVQAAAAQAPTPVVKRGTHVTLTSMGDQVAMRNMRPSVPVLWQVGVRVDAGEAGAVRVSLEAAGAAELGLELTVASCTVEWIDGRCAGVERAVGHPGAVSVGGGPMQVAELRSGAEQWFLVSAAIPAIADGTVALTLLAAGGSDTVTTGPVETGALAVSGTTPLWLLGVAAVTVGLLAAGVATIARPKRVRGAR